MKDLIKVIKELNIHSIALPPLGCGNGGLVENLIKEAFSVLPEVEVRLFAPNGAPKAKEIEIKTSLPKIIPGRVVILKVIETYRSLIYGLSKIEV